MKKVLIVDDEPAIREGLPYLINWENYGFSIQGTATNGYDGLKKIKALQPDLVISDIRMPEMNGLEMIQQAKEQGMHFQSIILSGYSEFDYAKKAMQLNSVSYLLKPIDEDELIEILIELYNREEKEQRASRQAILMNKIFGNDQKGLAEVGFIRALRVETQAMGEEVRNFVEGNPLETISLGHNGSHYVLLLTNQTVRELTFFDKQLQQWLIAQKTTIIDTGWHEKQTNLNLLYKKINVLKDLRFIYSNEYLSEEKIKENQGISLEATPVREKIFEAIIHNGDLEKAVFTYTKHFYRELPSEQTIKWQINQDYVFIVEELSQRLLLSLPESLDQIHKQIYNSQTLTELLALMINKYQLLQHLYAKAFNQLDIILEIKRYTEHHYQEELTLKAIADKFNYNSAYLGKKFKKDTGTTYLAYLESLRMKKAGELLASSNLMVYEVAEKIGYTNVDYFYKKFKQHYRLSPNEYRKKVGK